VLSPSSTQTAAQRFDGQAAGSSKRIAARGALWQRARLPLSPSTEPAMPESKPPESPPVSTGTVLIALWALSLPLAYIGIGEFLAQRFEGINFAQLPFMALGSSVIALTASIVVTIRWARNLPAKTAAADSTGDAVEEGLGRRKFLVGAGTLATGLVGTGAAVLGRTGDWILKTAPAVVTPVVVKTDPNPRATWKGATVQSYRRLGRTEFKVSDISLGSGVIEAGPKGEAIARGAIERGVNYFDTAPDYSAHGSEIALGNAMKGLRDKMFVATKFCIGSGHLQTGSSVKSYIEAVEGSLKRLQTDYVDLVHVHSCDSIERLMDPNLHEAFDRLKEQGKARFLGFSSHTPNLEAVAEASIESGRFDVMMLAYHHGPWPRLASIIDRAHAADMGVVAMKTLKGAKHHGMEEFVNADTAYSQAAFKWVLANPSVACLVVSFFELQHLDEYLYASGKSLTDNDLAVLERYNQAIAGTHCFAHCGDCLDACPEDLAINDVLRYRMYFEDYGRQKHGIEMYATLDKKADVCLGCAAPCAQSCPYDVPIRERTLGAHAMLTLGGNQSNASA
jgi:aryl-alcohol dehydrogenase-like predicted oxidoreductase